jgi:uncharacterized protein YcnI
MRAPSLRFGRPKPPRLAVAALAGIAVMLACPAVAAAHGEGAPGTVAPGEPATITFRVPSERATTVRLEVLFSARPAVVSAKPQNLPGWKIGVRSDGGDAMAGKPVTSIVWEGGTVPDGTFQEFPVLIDALPAGVLAFQGLQTYSDGQVVRWGKWIDPTEPPQPQPEHEPVVTVAPAAMAEMPEMTGMNVLTRGLVEGALVVALVVAGLVVLRRRSAGSRTEIADEAPEREKVQL